jgi:succinate dehydrogenase/fumarate reductase iron-sulfur protein
MNLKPKFEPQEILVKIQRFDPSREQTPRYQEYAVPLVFGMSVMNILDFIYENLDESLAYYSNCHRGLCGRCGMLVNGKAKLACAELVTDDLILEPLTRRRVIRDLVVEGV